MSTRKPEFTQNAAPVHPTNISVPAVTSPALMPILPTMSPEQVPTTAATTYAHTMYSDTCVVVIPYSLVPMALKMGDSA